MLSKISDSKQILEGSAYKDESSWAECCGNVLGLELA